MNKLFKRRKDNADFYDGSDADGTNSATASPAAVASDNSEEAVYGHNPPVGRKAPLLVGLSRMVKKGKGGSNSGSSASSKELQRVVDATVIARKLSPTSVLHVSDIAQQPHNATKLANAVCKHFSSDSTESTLIHSFKVFLICAVNSPIFSEAALAPNNRAAIAGVISSPTSTTEAKDTGLRTLAALASRSPQFAALYAEVRPSSWPEGGLAIDVDEFIFGSSAQNVRSVDAQLDSIEKNTSEIAGSVRVFQDAVAHAKGSELEDNALIGEFYQKCVKGQTYVDRSLEFVTAQVDAQETDTHDTEASEHETHKLPPTNPFAQDAVETHQTRAPTKAERILDKLLSVHSELTEAFKLYDLRLGVARENKDLRDAQQRSLSDAQDKGNGQSSGPQSSGTHTPQRASVSQNPYGASSVQAQYTGSPTQAQAFTQNPYGGNQVSPQAYAAASPVQPHYATGSPQAQPYDTTPAQQYASQQYAVSQQYSAPQQYAPAQTYNPPTQNPAATSIYPDLIGLMDPAPVQSSTGTPTSGLPSNNPFASLDDNAAGLSAKALGKRRE